MPGRLPGTQATPEELPDALLDDFRRHSAVACLNLRRCQGNAAQRPGSDGNALCMDFDFGAVSGYAVARRELPLDYPGQLRVLVRSARRSARQYASVQAGRRERRERLVGQSSGLRVSARMAARPLQEAAHLVCLGPDRRTVTLEHSAQLEFVGREGNRRRQRDSLCFDRLSFRQLPRRALLRLLRPVVRASSTLGANAAGASASTEDRHGLAQRSRRRPRADVDTGLSADRASSAAWFCTGCRMRTRRRYAIDFSDDGAALAHGAPGASTATAAPTRTCCPNRKRASFALRMQDGPAKAYALARDRSQRPRLRRFAQRIHRAHRKDAPRGHYPRGFAGEQSYWTVARHRRRQRSGAAVGGWRVGDRAAVRLDRTVSADRRRLGHVGRREGEAVAARRLSADPDRQLATAATSRCA